MDILSNIFPAEYLPQLLTITLLQIIGVMSPGPDFAMIVRNSLVHGRGPGVMTALGITGGIFVHLSYLSLGLGAVVMQSIVVLTALKIIGCSYLIFIGIKGLRARQQEQAASDLVLAGQGSTSMSNVAAFTSGFMCQATNPKAILFFLSLFTVVIDPATPMSVMGVYSAVIGLTTIAWFTTVALFLTHPSIRQVFTRLGHWIDRITGGILVALGIKIAFTAAR